jgi:hypothetical protein
VTNPENPIQRVVVSRRYCSKEAFHDHYQVFRSGAIIIIILSFGLFGLAMAAKGFTHDLLLEAGVFLVSVKLILMAKKNAETEKR